MRRLLLAQSVPPSMRFFGNGGESLTADVTNITFNTKDYDTHNAWGVSNTTFTTPTDGIYVVNGHIKITTNLFVHLDLYVGGLVKYRIHAAHEAIDIHDFSGQIKLAAGDALTIRSSINSILEPTSAATFHWIAITKMADALI